MMSIWFEILSYSYFLQLCANFHQVKENSPFCEYFKQNWVDNAIIQLGRDMENS